MVPVRVSVHIPGGAHFEEPADVRLEAGRNTYTLQRAKGSLLFEGKIPQGQYSVVTKADGWQVENRKVRVVGPSATASVYLGKTNWPFYRLGDNIVPFEPREDLVAVAFEARKPHERVALQRSGVIQQKLPLEPLAIDPKNPVTFAAADGAIWLFKFTRRVDPAERARVERELAQIAGADARVGLPVDLTPGQVKVIDNRFVVRFRDNLKPADIQQLTDKANATILREFIQAGNARLVRFNSGGYRDHLRIIEDWMARGLLVYGEPDILAEIKDDVFPDDPPDDPTFTSQLNLTLQDVDDAWLYLNGISSTLTLGDPSVYVATIDRGVDTDHPDIGGSLTDGTPQLAECYDFSNLQPCTDPSYAPETSHGMGVYGIIAALTDNATDIAGIAPNTHQIGVLRPSLSSSNYPDVLLWAAGFDTDNPTSGWPSEPISPGAAIISCSHGVDGLALSGLMDDTFQFLTSYGRAGRGTLVIYSAGNSDDLITGFRTWAAHPRTIAVANSLQPNASGVEVKSSFSNFGPEIDLCAQGDGAPSLNDVGGEQTFCCTSAAAPTVAAAAALMLSVESQLTWIDLRDQLRATAVDIDTANTDPVGAWSGGFSQWYGFGRLDVDDAVTAADTFDPAVSNICVRDNIGDTGLLVPTSGTFWLSPDLWVRNTDPATDPIGDPAYDEAPPHQSAVAGTDNWIRVRIKNVGSGTSGNAYVRAYLTHFAGSQFQYPEDYIPSVNTGDPLPTPLVQATYLVGEAFVDSVDADEVQILNFEWPAELVPPEEVAGVAWHPCLLAEVSPNTGPDPSGDLVTDYANLAQRNISIDYDDGSDDTATMGVIGHETSTDAARCIVVERGKLPKSARLWVRFPDRRVENAVAKQLAEAPRGCACAPPPCGQAGAGRTHGHTSCLPLGGGRVISRVVDGQRVFELTSGSRMVLRVPMVNGPLTPVVVGIAGLDPKSKNTYEVPVMDYSESRRLMGAFSLERRPAK